MKKGIVQPNGFHCGGVDQLVQKCSPGTASEARGRWRRATCRGGRTSGRSGCVGGSCVEERSGETSETGPAGGKHGTTMRVNIEEQKHRKHVKRKVSGLEEQYRSPVGLQRSLHNATHTCWRRPGGGAREDKPLRYTAFIGKEYAFPCPVLGRSDEGITRKGLVESVQVFEATNRCCF